MQDTDYTRFPSKKDALEMLRSLGVEFGCVFDVGVQGKTQELIDVFPNLKHYLFEPVAHYIPMIERNYAQIDHEILNVAVSDRDGSGRLQVRNVGGGGGITHSAVIGDSAAAALTPVEVVDITLLRLSSLLARRSFPEPILLKIDVDGHEMAILDGLQGGQDKIGAVVIEATLTNLGQRLDRAQKMGFVLWDINDLCYYKGCLWQVDMVLLAPAIAARAEMRPLNSDRILDWSKWQPFSRH